MPSPTRRRWRTPLVVAAVTAGATVLVWAGATGDLGLGDDPATAPPGVGADPVRAEGSTGARFARVDPAWVDEVADATGIGATATRAYAQASMQIRREQPACQLAWTTLAGIGWIETRHGTFEGSEVADDGRVRPLILGPRLDGTDGTAEIPATDLSRRLTGDPDYERAVGPMQFLPSTWSDWGSDGDRDGRRDPSNLFDAAYAAGRYLCADESDLSDADGWRAAVLRYNRSNAYVDDVLQQADAYAGDSLA